MIGDIKHFGPHLQQHAFSRIVNSLESDISRLRIPSPRKLREIPRSIARNVVARIPKQSWLVRLPPVWAARDSSARSRDCEQITFGR